MFAFENDFSAVDKGFVVRYGAQCSKFFKPNSNLKYIIKFVKMDDMHNILNKDEPFACNPCGNGDGVRYVAYNTELIKRYELTREEQFAFIAHEIGHILMFYDNDIPQSSILKEIKADDVALKLGLKESLLSGLRKIKELNLECIEERIRKIEEQK